MQQMIFEEKIITHIQQVFSILVAITLQCVVNLINIKYICGGLTLAGCEVPTKLLCHNLTHHDLHRSLPGNLCFHAWSTSSLSFFTQLVVCRVVSLTFSLLSCLKYHRGATTVADGLGLCKQWVHLGVGWHRLCQTWVKFPAASHRWHPCSPLNTKTLQCKTNTTL